MKEEVTRPPAPRWALSVLVLVSLLLYFPLAVMAIGAFHVGDEWGFTHFVKVFRNQAWIDATLRSLWVGLAASAGSMILGAGAALAMERPGRRLLPILLALAMVVPEIVFALVLLTWFAWLFIPLSLVTVIAAHVTFCMSFSFLIVRGRLQKLDPSLFEAAADLGAGPLQILLKIKIPLLVPSLVASFFISFLLSFDDFLISFFVNGVGSDTLPIKLYTSMKMGMTPELNALATLLAILSGLGLTLVFQSRTIQGILR